MKLRFALLAVLLAASPGLAAAGDARLHFPVNGFSIAPLESAWDDTPVQTIAMTLRKIDGFAPNVNVQVQPYASSLADYLALTRRQLTSVGIELLAEPEIDGSRLRLEYAGSLRGRDLHWYGVAIQDGSRVVLATATALESQWAESGAKLKEVVDSLRVDKGD